MNDAVMALLLMVGGLCCVAAWGVCRIVTERRSYQLEREADAIKDSVVRGGRVPKGVPMELARGYFYLRWLDIIGHALLAAGIAIMAAAQFFIF